MESWLGFALLSAISAALVGIFGKIGLEGVDSVTATALRSVVMLITTFTVALATHRLSGISAFSSRNWVFLLLSGIAGGFSWIAYFAALKLGPATRVVPIDRLSVVFTFVLAVVVLHEKVTTPVVIGNALILLGGLIIAFAR